MGSRNHEARDSESPKAPDARGPSRDSATRSRPAPETRSDAAGETDVEHRDAEAAASGASETRPSQPAPAVMPYEPDEAADEIEPHVAISFGVDGEHVPPSSGPMSRSNIAGRYR